MGINPRDGHLIEGSGRKRRVRREKMIKAIKQEDLPELANISLWVETVHQVSSAGREKEPKQALSECGG